MLLKSTHKYVLILILGLSRVEIWHLELSERSTHSDGALQRDSNGRVDRAHHGNVDEPQQEGDQVGEENSLKCHQAI